MPNLQAMLTNKIFTFWPKTQALALGILSVGILPPYYLLPLSLVCFSCLYLLLWYNPQKKRSFGIGYWFGFGHFSIGLSWAANALLIDAETYGWLYPIAIAAAGLFFGLFIGLPAVLSAFFKSPWSKLLAFTGLWGLSEWLRSFILTGFPWNLLGSALTFNPQYFQTVAIYGTYGLSIVLLLWSILPSIFLFHGQRSKVCALGLFILIPGLIWSYGYSRINQVSPQFKTPGINIRMVQPSIEQDKKWAMSALEDNFARHIALGAASGLEKVDFVIWGETASPFPLDMDSFHRHQVLESVPPHGYLITGLVRVQTSPYGELLPYNSMLIINKQGKIENYYDKAHLVPFGEYIPLRRFLPEWIKPITNTVANFQAGPGPRTINLGSYPPFGVLICYEIIFPAEITNSNQRPEWLINLTNDAWYGDSAGPRQHLIATRLRAAEEGLSIIRVANSGISAAIDPLGRIIGQIPLNQSQILDVSLPSKLSTKTIYGNYGNFVPIIFISLLIILAIYLCLHKI